MFEALGEYGIAIFSIGAIVYVVKLFVGFMRNHIQHHSEVALELKNAVCNLLKFLERSNGSK